MSIKILQLHKRASYQYKFIQDKLAYNESFNSVALADGTTQSFNSEKWAEIITKNFVNNPTFDPDSLIELFSKDVDEFKNSKFEFSSNPAMASLEKTKIEQGGTATFIGLQFSEKGLKVISCGDTNLFKISNSELYCFPFNNVNALDSNNHFINTEKLIQKEVDENHFQTKDITYNINDTIILATDALSRLILKNPKVLSEVLSINNFEQLHDFCISKWNNKEMEEDDISAIIIHIDNINQLQLIKPDNSFSFPKEEEKPFEPFSVKKHLEQSTPYNNMDEIRRNFNGIARDFEEVKKTLLVQKLLIMTIIGLLFIILLLLYFSRPQQSNKVQKELIEKNEGIDNQENNSKILPILNKKQKKDTPPLDEETQSKETENSTPVEPDEEN